MISPSSIEEEYIYDVYYARDRIMTIRPPRAPPIEMQIDNENIKGYVSHIQEYSLLSPYKETVNLTINGKLYENVKVNHYSDLENETCMTTMVKNEDKYIVQWIEYHKKIGFTKFIIYDNSKSPNTRYSSDENISDLESLLYEFIKKGEVILIEWKYSKSYLGIHVSGQKTQQHHALMSFTKAKYIAFMDVDEYINISNFEKQNIQDILPDILVGNKVGLQMWCKFMQNNDKLPDNDYEFLKITHFFYCINGEKNVPSYRGNNSPKFIVIPKYINSCAIHNFTPMRKYKSALIKSYESIYFNHYYFLNKKSLTKWRNTRLCELKDESLVKYYDILSKKQ